MATQPSRTTGRLRNGVAGFKDFLARYVRSRTRPRDQVQAVDSHAYDMRAPLTNYGSAGTGAEPPATDNTPGIWQVKIKSIAAGGTYDFTLGQTLADASSARGFFTATRGTNVWSGDFQVEHDGTTGGGGIKGFTSQPAACNVGLEITGVVSGGAFLLRLACDSVDVNATNVELIYHVAEG